MLNRVKNISANIVRTKVAQVASFFNGIAEEIALTFAAPATLRA
jgi:hypothetical protein